MYKYSVFLTSVASLLFYSFIAIASPECNQAKPINVGEEAGYLIDETWTGVNAPLDGVTRGNFTYFGYYSTDRKLSVAQFDNITRQVCRLKLDSVFSGFDAHNVITLRFDDLGKLHVAGNMHDSQLVYASASEPDSLNGLTIRPMIGKDEQSATYPAFLSKGDGKLFFMYRNGTSGKGEWFANQFINGQWRRLVNSPIFSGLWKNKDTSAYPTTLSFSRDGFLHLAIVWRYNSDVKSNYIISYAKTKDLVNWTDHLGRSINLPMTPGNMDKIDFPGENAGLLNWQKLTVMPNGNLVIAYTKYDHDGRNEIILTSPGAGGWLKSIIAVAKQRSEISGKGTLSLPPFFDAPRYVNDNICSIDISFPGEPRRTIYFDMVTFKALPSFSPATQHQRTSRVDLSDPDLIAPITTVRRVRSEDKNTKASSLGTMIYIGQGFNGDRTRRCTANQPRACSPPPGPLVFVPAHPAEP